MSDLHGTTRQLVPGGGVVFAMIPPGMHEPVPMSYSEAFTDQTRTAPNGDVVRVNAMGDVGQDPMMRFLFTQDADGSVWLYGVEFPDGSVEWVTRPDSGRILNYPGRYELGISWEQDYQMTGPNGPGPATHLTHMVTDVEEVTVPLGTFQCFKIVSTDADGAVEADSWFAPELGVNIKKLTYAGPRPGYALMELHFDD